MHTIFPGVELAFVLTYMAFQGALKYVLGVPVKGTKPLMKEVATVTLFRQ